MVITMKVYWDMLKIDVSYQGIHKLCISLLIIIVNIIFLKNIDVENLDFSI